MIQNSPSGGTIQPSSLNATVGRVAAIATALLLVAFLVLSVSRAAFSADTANEKNYVRTGVVTLTDNDFDLALFEYDNTDEIAGVPNPLNDIVPGVAVVKCISVDYAGDFASGPIQMYAIASDDAAVAGEIGDLDEYLDVKIERIDNSAVATAKLDNPTHACNPLYDFSGATVYTTTLADFPSSYNDTGTAAPGEISHAATAPNTQTFRISVTVQDTAGAAGANADWNFVWETRSA